MKIPLGPLPVRLIFLLIVVVALSLLGYSIGKGAVGSSFTTYAQRSANLTDEARLEATDIGVRLAPTDPTTLYGRGTMYMAQATDELLEPRLVTAIADLRKAAALSPEDYRIWLALGRALDRNGESAEGRTALERAAGLAPNFFETRWALANHRLREGDREAAFVEFRAALTTQPVSLPLIFDYAWQAYNQDARAVITALSPPGEARARLLSMLIYRGKVPEALENWEKMAHNPADTRLILQSLMDSGHYGAAFRVWSESFQNGRPTPDPGSLLANGSFEHEVKLGSDEPFYSWNISRAEGLGISLDNKTPQDGKLALRLSFEVERNIRPIIASQTVPARPATRYQMTFWIRTEDLLNLSPLVVEVFDPAQETKSLGSFSLALGNHKWSEETLDFTTSSATEAIRVRLQQTPCGDPVCKVKGRVWLDGFKITAR
jgi:tetratricopeptide (TPR) repeat protein